MSNREVLQVRVTPEQKAAWREAAAAEGVSLSRWIRRQADRASAKQPLPIKKQAL